MMYVLTLKTGSFCVFALHLVLLAIERQLATWQAPGVAIAWQMATGMAPTGAWWRLRERALS